MHRHQRLQHYKRRLQKVVAIEKADANRFKPNPRGEGYLTKAERYAELRFRLADLIEEYQEREPDDERAREALGLPPLYHDDSPSLDTSFHDHEMDV